MRALHSRGIQWFFGAALTVGASFALAQAPIIDSGQPMPRSGKSNQAANGGGAQDSGSATGALSLQMQQLQQEVSELRGIVEEQRHQLDTLKQQSSDRYNDLDSRLNQGQQAPGAAAPAAAADAGIPADTAPTPPGAASAPAAAAPVAAAAATGGMQTAKPEEYETYQKAYAKLKGQDISGAIKAFNAFLATYPNSSLAGNAYYWLGKAYLQPPSTDAAKAQTAFSKVANEMPQHTKAPDSLYELGKIYFNKGDKAKAKSLMQQVIDNYGTSGSTAPQLAKQFIDQNLKK